MKYENGILVWESEDKRNLEELMDGLKIKAKPLIWSLVKNGATVQQVEDMVLLLHTRQNEEEDRKGKIVLDEIQHYNIFGKQLIQQNTIDDMNQISRLPYVKELALMPDAHRVKENHVPVGGVVITDDCILPGVVGNDISCMMRGTMTDVMVNDTFWENHEEQIEHVLKNKLFFGLEYNTNEIAKEDNPFYTPVLQMSAKVMGQLVHTESKALLKGLIGTIRNHFGTSGDGNHFVSIGYSNLYAISMGNHSAFSPTRGKYLMILSHSGSRGLGSNVADFYLKKANEINPVPKGMEDNAPLFFGVDDWAEDYLLMMELCGFFAEQTHLYIHDLVLKQLAKRIPYMEHTKTYTIANKHNYAWVTEHGFIHRKGSTPAESGVLGIIPATMGDVCKIVIGNGNMDYLNSASHGAGRVMSRGQAFKQKWEDVHTYVKREHGVTLIGGGTDEDPRSYKVLNQVMHFQQESVEIIGDFTPKFCRMADERFQQRRKK